MQTLQGALEEALAGRGSLVMLTGEAGIGKTRIALEFAQRARARGAMVLRGSGVEGDWAPPYAPWVDALVEYARSTDLERLRALLGRGGASLAQLLPQVQGAAPSLPAPAPLSPEEERFRLYDSVVQFFMVVTAATPVLLILDDLHWVDRDSLRLLRHVARFLSRLRVLILGAYRHPELDGDNRLPEVLGALQREPEYRHLHIRGLDDAEVAEYLAQAGGEELPRTMVRAIRTETSGNPFYVRELFRQLLDEGKLRISLPSGFTVRDLGIPEGVRLLVDRRLSRLSREANSLLGLAAGFTGGFHLPEIQLLSSLSEESVLDCLDEALGAGFLHTTADTPPAYDFAHAIVRHALYGRLNPDRRARLHRRIALALERAYAGREMEYAAELATQYHASAALPGADKGIPFALEASERARAAVAHEGAVRFLRMASDLSAKSPPSGRAPILCRRAVAEAEALMLDEAPRSVREALAALSEAGAEPRAQAQFLEAAVRTLKDGGAGASLWEPLVEEGIALLGEERDLLWARLTLLRSSLEPGAAGEIVVPRWLGLDRQAVEIARALGDEDDYARTLASPDWRTREETEQVLVLARRWKSPGALIRGLQVVAQDLFYRQGEFREAVARLDELRTVAERYGALPAQAEALGQMAMALTTLGDFTRAGQCAQVAYQMIARLGSAHGLRLTQAGVAAMLAYALGGDWARLAEGAGRLARSPEVPQAPYPMNRSGLIAAAMGAYAHNRVGNRAEARRLLDALTPLAESLEPTMLGHNGLVAIAGTAIWEMEAGEYAQAYRRMAIALMEAGVGVSAQGPHQLTVARMAALLGDTEVARDCFARSRLLLEERGMQPIRAVVDYDEALTLLRAHAADPPSILVLLNSARSRFEGLGMGVWIERTQALDAEVPGLERPRFTGVPIRLSDYQARQADHRGAKDSLTPREREVAALVAGGFSNSEIAAQLVISVRTAETHVDHILGKLGFSSRAQVAVWAVGEGLVDAGNNQGDEHGLAK